MDTIEITVRVNKVNAVKVKEVGTHNEKQHEPSPSACSIDSLRLVVGAG